MTAVPEHVRVAPAGGVWVPAIVALHERVNARAADRAGVDAAVAGYPSAVAVDGDGELAGFAYCGRFAPDILELRNILVRPDLRSAGVGSLLLAAVEGQAAGGWASVVAVNSLAYPTPGKRPATSFYERHGYMCVWSTRDTRLFAKDLTVPRQRP